MGSTAADLLMSLVYHCLQPYLDIWFSLCWLMGQWCMVLSCIHQPPCCAEYVSCGSFHCIAVSTTCFTCHLYIYYILAPVCLLVKSNHSSIMLRYVCVFKPASYSSRRDLFVVLAAVYGFAVFLLKVLREPLVNQLFHPSHSLTRSLIHCVH